MGFFYQAIKKATGQPEDAAALDAAVATVAAEPAPYLADSEPHKPVRQHFELQHPLPNLVAFLTPPVLPQNVAAMEQCRVIRSRLRDIMRAKKIKTIMLTSATASEGKTLLAVNLAFTFSQLENARVLLVDCDLRRPSIGKVLGMNMRKGLGTYLTKQDPFEQVCWQLSPKLDVVPTQELVADAAEHLHGTRMQQFLAYTAAEYSLVLIDAPPLFPIVDAQALAGLVDGAIMVVRAGSTPYDMAAQGAEIIKSKLIGSILNCVDKLPHGDYYGAYGYGGYGGLRPGQR